MSGQSIMDRVVAAKHSIAGQGLAKSVCKATTEEVMGPKKKHLDYLLQCTNEPNVSIPQLADLLIERTQHQSWVVVFKSLITIHNLMNYGNERFTQYLASNNCTFNLGNFIDKGGVQEGKTISGYDMSTFIRRYSKYLNEKATSYRNMAFDFCKVKRGKDDGLLRTMNADKLLKSLPALQRQIDALIEFDCTPNELTNGVINACFLLMFKDLIRLFACYNDGIINLLEKYFDMNKKQCKDALEIYKRFLVRMDKVSEFLKVAENVGIDKGDIPDLAKAPSSLLDALEQHLQALEGKKGAVTPTNSKPAGYTSAINSISSNSTIQISDEEKKRILDEENNRLQMLKDQHSDIPLGSNTQEQRLKEMGSPPQSAQQQSSTNPFAASPVSTGSNLLGSPTTAEPVKASDDLLSLTGNPFVENVQQVMAMNATVSTMNAQPQFATPAWNNTPSTNNVTAPATSGFTSDADFDKAFQNSSKSSTGFDAFGEVLQPQNTLQQSENKTQQKLIQGDLNTSLAQLAGNLNINGPGSQVKKAQHEWQPKGEQKKTGGSNWQHQQPVSSSTISPAFGQPMMSSPVMYNTSPQAPMMQPGMMGQPRQPMVAGMGMGMQPMGVQPVVGIQQPMMYGGMQQQPMFGGMQQPVGVMPQPRPPGQSNTNDPFGAL